MVRSAYLDYNATAPMRPEVRRAVTAAMAWCGNPSSVHRSGRLARRTVEAPSEAKGAPVSRATTRRQRPAKDLDAPVEILRHVGSTAEIEAALERHAVALLQPLDEAEPLLCFAAHSTPCIPFKKAGAPKSQFYAIWSARGRHPRSCSE